MLLENNDGDAGRFMPLAAPSEGGLTAGERDLVKVRRSYSLEGLLFLELPDNDWPLPCRVTNVPLVLAFLIDWEPICRCVGFRPRGS